MDKQARKSLWAIFFAATMGNFSYAVVLVMFLPLILSPNSRMIAPDISLSVRYTYLGILFASFSFAQLFGAPFIGDAADQMGRKKITYLSMGGTIAGLLLSGVAVLLSSFSLLLLSRLITGFCSGYLSVCLAAIADLSPTETIRSRNFGIATIIWVVSCNVAMLMGGYLSDSAISPLFNPALPLWVTAALTLLSGIVLHFYYIAPATHEAPTRLSLSKGVKNILEALKMAHLRPFFIIVLFWCVGWTLALQWYSPYGILKYHVTQATVSWGLFIQGITWSIGGAIVNPLFLRRYKPVTIALIGFMGTALLLFVMGFVSTYLFFNLFWWGSAIFSSFALSNAMHLTSMAASNDIQGKVMGLNQSMLALGGLVSPLLGAAIGAINTQLFYPAAGCLLAVALCITFVQKRKTKPSHHHG